MAPRLSSERSKAVLAAIKSLVAEVGGNKSAAARAIKIRQQSLDRAIKHQTVGEKIADLVADYYGTSVDGLVRRFSQKDAPVRVGDIAGWREAVRVAKEESPYIDAWAWHRAADVVLPVGPDFATPQFAFELALLLKRYGEVSGVIYRAK
jgi:hypothetical protein